MIYQLVIGSVLLTTTVMVSGLGYIALEVLFQRLHPWLARPPHLPKQLIFLNIAALGILSIVTVGIWIWAVALQWLGAFATLEESVYFSAVAYTTLGLGDVVLPTNWRLLSGILAANGFINFGLSTAVMIDAMRELRQNQRQTLDRDD